MGWHCQKCKHWIVDNWDTCTYCGASKYGTYPSSTQRSYLHAPKRNNKIAKAIVIVVILLGIVYALTNTNILNRTAGLFAELSKGANTSSSTYPVSTQTYSTRGSSVNVSSNLVFCINRMVFRTSNSRGLNSSQIQQLVSYCQYYDYNPGVQNNTNYTTICQGVKSCGG